MADPKYRLCRPCRSATVALAGRRADAVAPISYAVKGGQLANELWRYKGSAIIDREHYVLGFTAVLWRFLTEHEACLAAAAGAPDFSLVTTVPSTRWRAGEHPLADIVRRRIPGTSRRYLPCLEPDPLVTQERVLDAQRFRVAGATAVRGADVLLVDGTWTSGGHAQSAAAALKEAGARRVAVVVLGRWLTVEYSPEHRGLAARARTIGFDWSACCFHRR